MTAAVSGPCLGSLWAFHRGTREKVIEIRVLLGFYSMVKKHKDYFNLEEGRDMLLRSVRCVKLATLEVKVPPIQATKALRVGRGIALPFLRPRH